MRTLTARDDGRELRLAVGDAFTLTLDETPTTGFRWSVTSLPAMLTVTDDRFAPPGVDRPGEGGVHRWTFDARAAGHGALRIELTAATRRSSAPRVFKLDVRVG